MSRSVYLPGDYLARAKRPIPGVRRNLVQEDLVWWLLIALTGHKLNPGYELGILLLFASFWSIYDLGYWENDYCALAYEEDPVVTPAAAHFHIPYFALQAWCAALLFGIAGVLFLPKPAVMAPLWLAVLISLRLVYYVYNRVDKPSRVWFYLLLQGFRSLALAAVLPLGAAGIIAGLAQMLARWQAYYFYRQNPCSAWRNTPARTAQFSILLAGLGFMALVKPPLAVWGWPSLGLLAWNGWLARRQITAILAQAHWLPRAGKRTPGPPQ